MPKGVGGGHISRCSQRPDEIRDNIVRKSRALSRRGVLEAEVWKASRNVAEGEQRRKGLGGGSGGASKYGRELNSWRWNQHGEL